MSAVKYFLTEATIMTSVDGDSVLVDKGSRVSAVDGYNEGGLVGILAKYEDFGDGEIDTDTISYFAEIDLNDLTLVVDGDNLEKNIRQ